MCVCVCVNYTAAREHYKTNPGLRHGSSSAFGLKVQAHEFVSCHNGLGLKKKKMIFLNAF